MLIIIIYVILIFKIYAIKNVKMTKFCRYVSKQECIPVGWVPTAAVVATRGRPPEGGIPLGGKQTHLKTLPSLAVGNNLRWQNLHSRIHGIRMLLISWNFLEKNMANYSI